MKGSALILPGWGVDPALYRDLAPGADLFDYGFFSPEETPMRHPGETCAAGRTIIAHSMGTAFALRCAAADPTVRELVLFNPFPRFSRAEDFPCGWKTEDITALRNGMEKNASVTLKHFYRNCAFPDRIRIEPPEKLNLTALLEGLNFLATFDFRGLLPSVRCPVTVLTGSSDRIVSREMSSFSINGPLAVKEFDSGHFLPFSGKAREVF